MATAAYARLLLALAMVSMLLFLPAGTLDYWEAWAYLAMMLAASSTMVAYLCRTRPDLLERRMRMREKEPQQRRITRAASVWFVVAYLVPGLDHRLGWSDVSLPAVMSAQFLILLGYGVIFWVFRVNPYASRIIEVEPDQQVVVAGPYAVVRHPMHVAGLLVHLATPLALGSYWALLPAVLIVPITIARIGNEERVLARGLPGYQDYLGSTRYRLIPGFW